MKNLIVYMSTHGTTEKVAVEICNRIGKKDTLLVNLDKEKVPNLSDFDLIIIGGSIHAGNIQSKIKKFYSENMNELINKKVALFICYMEKNKGQEEFDLAFPEQLRNHSIANGLLGGEFLFDKMNFIERFAVKKIAKVRESKYEINYEAIEEFSAKLS